MKPSLYPILFLLCVTLATSIAVAQQPLDPFGTPEAGSVALPLGFMPDPLRVPIVGGGEVDANSRALGNDCVGFISVQPDFRVTTEANFGLLRFIYIADTITTDTSLVVRTPDGRYVCNNNAFNIFNPMVDSADSGAGDYAVWVGGFSPNMPVYGNLYITTNSSIIPGSTGVVMPIMTSTPAPTPVLTPTATQLGGTALDANLAASHGRAVLQAGFLPDPYWDVLVGGGALSVPRLNEQVVENGFETLSQCGGYTDSAPDFELEWSGRSTRLRFHFIPVGVGGVEPDTALIVQAPDGTWSCNRDFAPGFTRPSVEFINPAAGTYHVWVAHEESAGVAAPGVIYVAEIASTPETVRQAATTPVANLVGLDVGEVPPGSAELSLQSDPFTINGLLAGGGLDIASVNADPNQPNLSPACEGFYSTTPTLVLNLTQPLSYLRAFFIADDDEADPTLIVRMPDGQWYCGDDSFGTLSPTLNIIGNPSSGIVRIWGGSYRADEFVSGTLYLTRGNAAPSRDGVVGIPTPTLAIASALTPITLPTTITIPTAAPIPNPVGLDAAGAPAYGTTSLGAAFVPHTLAAGAGGTLDASPLGENCVGFVSPQPDYRVQWTGTGSFLRFYFVALGDTTLVVSSPDGTWHCNDDSYVSVNPTVDIPNAVTGTYNVWIGSFDEGISLPGTLYITEDSARNPGN